MSNVPGNVKAVEALLQHPAFNMGNPNCCYSLFLGFVMSPVNFHAADGSGYRFLVDSILQAGLRAIVCTVRLKCWLPVPSMLACLARRCTRECLAALLQQRAGMPWFSSVLTALSLQVDKINHQVAARMVGPFTQVHPAALLRF